MNLLTVYVIKHRDAVAGDIRAAAQRILDRGFAKFVRHASFGNVESGYADRVGAVCLLGAFEPSSGSSAEDLAPQALNIIATWLPVDTNRTHVGDRIVTWNNASERTKDEVLGMLQTVADKVEAGILEVKVHTN